MSGGSRVLHSAATELIVAADWGQIDAYFDRLRKFPDHVNKLVILREGDLCIFIRAFLQGSPPVFQNLLTGVDGDRASGYLAID